MNHSVLLIEDDPATSKLLAMLIKGWGLKVETAGSGEAGIEKLQSRAFDVVLTDIRLPGMSGNDVLRKVKEDTPDLPVVLLTAHGSVKAAVEAVKEGAFNYLLKPPDPDEFELVVRRAIEYGELRRENKFLRTEMASIGPSARRLLGRSPGMVEVFDIIDRVARTDSTVLISGETGTGKELIAQTIHFRSRRADKAFVACNCAALHENLLESELFGHERGAFTGAVMTRRGRFEDADGGTLFLDEIAETSREFQAKLLRVLQEGEFERVGGNRPMKVDVRVLASTNRNLEELVKENIFREDLYYRLRVVPIHVPPLRERKEDIIPLAMFFLNQYATEYGSGVKDLSSDAREYLLGQTWKGNVRELQHTIERAVVLARGEVLAPADLSLATGKKPDQEQGEALQECLDRATRVHVLRVLDMTDWHKQRAAEVLGIDRVTLYRILKKYSIEKRGGPQQDAGEAGS